jgi:hypothetical protein
MTDAMGTLKLQSNGRWLIERPNGNHTELSSGSAFRVGVDGKLKLTHLEFAHGEGGGRYYSVDGYPLRDGLRAAGPDFKTDGETWNEQMREQLRRSFPWVAKADAGRWYLYNGGGACMARFNLDTPHEAKLAAAAPALLDATNALLGLIQLVCSRDDIAPLIKEALQTSHRVTQAREALAKADAEYVLP